MARLILHSFALFVVCGSVSIARAQAIDDETLSVAAEAGVDPIALNAAAHTTGLGPRTYLCAVGELHNCPRPATPREYAHQAYPDVAACIDQIVQVESPGWFANGWNPIPVGRYGEHASGLGGFLPSTWASTPERDRSIWDPFAQVDAIHDMLMAGRGREFAAVAWGRCG